MLTKGKKPEIKCHIVYESTYLKCPEWVNSLRKKVNLVVVKEIS